MKWNNRDWLNIETWQHEITCIASIIQFNSKKKRMNDRRYDQNHDTIQANWTSIDTMYIDLKLTVQKTFLYIFFERYKMSIRTSMNTITSRVYPCPIHNNQHLNIHIHWSMTIDPWHTPTLLSHINLHIYKTITTIIMDRSFNRLSVPYLYSISTPWHISIQIIHCYLSLLYLQNPRRRGRYCKTNYPWLWKVINYLRRSLCGNLLFMCYSDI